MSKFFFYDNKFIDWTIKILFSINLILIGMNYESCYYPLNVLILIIIAFWLYSFKLKVIGFPFLLFALLINYFRIGMDQFGC